MLIISILLQIFETAFITTEFIDVFFVKANLDLLLTNLKFSMQGAVNICKAWSFIAWQKDWRAVCDYVTRADIANRSSLDPKKKENIESFTKYCRIAELEALKIDTAAIFDSSESDAIDRIRDCHKRHIELIHYSGLYNSCTSPILLLYSLMCTVVLCSTAYQITSLETSKTQQLMTVMYLIFGVAQLFLYCWHSNEVLYASMDLIRGPYESKWWTQSPSHQRNLFILVVQLSKIITFTAGPFTDLTVATFINILKGAYSYYTLL
ncbi:odorant receptor 22c-like [Pieris rapae]|uniref:odorant receptor 22c-like n=1 Tax=Pieris rapae TaxID=64459 RepID=UPI001E281560|nr:odorant receptor 22c-like [Pieris rapae]